MLNNIKQILRENVNHEVRIKMDIPLPQDIISIKDVFTKYNYKLYLVGGSVRDAILGHTPKDFDLVTDAIPDKVEEIMNHAGFKTIPTGKSFGVINVITDDGEYEIATFRNDQYNDDKSSSDGRRPDSVTFTDIYGDSARRDLTINALYYDIDTHEVIDLVGGLNDLKNGITRTVGSSEDRFNEDKLRILRSIRFASRFGSELDKDIDMALQKNSDLSQISGERIRDEFIKGIKSAKSQKKFIEMLEKYHLFRWIFKDLNVDFSILKTLGSYNYDDYIILIASLLKNNKIDVLKKKLNELKYSVDEVKAITFLIAMLSLDVDTAVALKKAEQHAGVTNEQIRQFCLDNNVNSQLLDAFEKFNLSVSGQEVMDKFNIKAGPELGKMITKLETDNFTKLL